MTLFESHPLPESTFSTYEEAYIQKSSRPVANDQLIEIIAELLAEIIKSTSGEGTVSIFTAKKLPTVSIKDYLNRLAKFCYCSQEAFIVALIFLDRLTSYNKSFTINNGNVHRYYLLY